MLTKWKILLFFLINLSYNIIYNIYNNIEVIVLHVSLFLLEFFEEKTHNGFFILKGIMFHSGTIFVLSILLLIS